VQTQAKKCAWYTVQNRALAAARKAQADLINKLLAAASKEGLARLVAREMQKKIMLAAEPCIAAAVVQEVRSAAGC
jgi:hypothetical protein